MSSSCGLDKKKLENCEADIVFPAGSNLLPEEMFGDSDCLKLLADMLLVICLSMVCDNSEFAVKEASSTVPVDGLAALLTIRR